MPEIVLVVARADNGVIGRDGALPWHIPADLRHFKAITSGSPMVMGRRTFDSLPGLLPGRAHIVLTRDPLWQAASVTAVGSVEQAITAAGDAERVSVIGGASIYSLFMPVAGRVELTEVHAAPDGDTTFGYPPMADWVERGRRELPAEGPVPGLTFLTFRRR